MTLQLKHKVLRRHALLDQELDNVPIRRQDLLDRPDLLVREPLLLHFGTYSRVERRGSNSRTRDHNPVP